MTIRSEEEYVYSLNLLKLCFRPELGSLAGDLVLDLLHFIANIATTDAARKIRPQSEPPKCCETCFWTWDALNDAADLIEKGAV
ncbi:hypothetical protein [Streptomyces sp. CBMA29]|uniref:hypothetical protein n=1 Tax=Streptomyces sp. CBMA29 TaxID=1896314 RepID=UPI0016619029|nr:hypothetical protein [Streptomyces sp. CBMA29]MBD0739866.1 hypothetical protein [Streptomyces sp. CBMA29]